MSEMQTKDAVPVGYKSSGGGNYLDFAEALTYVAQFTSRVRDYVDVSATGFIRTIYRDAMILSMGWVDSILADNDLAPASALVINVVEVSSPNTTQGTRTYTALDFVEAPTQLQSATQPMVVFCYLEPGTPTDPPVQRKMKRTRVNVTLS
jgi:hypothetical protein